MTPTTQREADERALFEAAEIAYWQAKQPAHADPLTEKEKAYLLRPAVWDKTSYEACGDRWQGWQWRAAIDQSTRQAAPEAPATTDFNGDALYAAWHKVGADVAGLHFADFIAALGSRPPVAAPDAHAHEDPRITAFYKLRDIAERDEDIESANIIQLAISKLHWAKVDAAATMASASTIKTWQERCGDTGPTPSLDQAARAMKAEIADLRAALARAPLPTQAVDVARDAARYRFLRHADLDEIAEHSWKGQEVPTGAEFDQAVDAAMSRTNTTGDSKE